MMNEYLIRPMEAGDREAVVRFYASLGDVSTSFFNVNHGNEARTMEFFENGKPDHRFTVVVHGNEIAALAFIWDIDSAIPWFGICVNDRFQKRGLGSALLRHVLAQCRAHGCGGILLRTAKNNYPAQALYEAHGFEQIGTHASGEFLYLKRFERKGVC